VKGMIQMSMTYREKIDRLRIQKEQQTQDKIKAYGRMGFFDTDDKGTVLPPEGWSWTPEASDANGGWFGNQAVSANFCRLLQTHPVYIDPLSSLAGAYMVKQEWFRKAGWPSGAEFDFPELRLLHIRYDLVSGIGGAHHFHHDVENIGFKLGWKGILEKIRHYLDVHRDDAEKVDFLKAEEAVVLAIQGWIWRNAQAAQELAAEQTEPDLRANLEHMAEMNFKLVNDPPETFLEACQWLSWFLLQAVMFNGGAAGGALENMLTPYYERDVAAGILTREEAVYHLACLLLKDNTYYEIGGTHPDGTDRTNVISYLTLEAAHLLRIPNALCLRIHENIDRAFVRKAVEYLFADKSGAPAFLGDRAMVEGFMKNGYTEQEARCRYKTGCHWCALPGTEYTLNDVVKINMAKVFDVAFWEMMDDKKAEPSVVRLWELFDKHMGLAVGAIADSIDFHMDHMYRVLPELAMDFMCHGPIERGLDISHGGVDNYNFCVDGAGLGVVADCFASLEQRVEQEKRYTWSQMAHYLETNWEGAEDVRLLMKRVPRYGAGGTTADRYAVKIVQDVLVRQVKAGPTPHGYNMIPGLFSWANTIGMGKKVGATPNGRKAFEPITHGANPEPGFKESSALTAMGIAVASVQPGWGNTAPIQLEIDPILGRDEDGIDRITAFLMTYCNDLGGTLVNINILDKEKVLDAHAHPEKHPDLVVRVTGFSAYFSALSKDFRQLVVDRIIEG
jgi:pyruvate-formate lyase